MNKEQIEEGLISRSIEIYKLSKKIFTPFQKYLKSLGSYSKSDTDDKTILNPLNKFISMINSSGISDKTKEKMIFDMYLDSYVVLYDSGNMNGQQIKSLLNIPDNIYKDVLKQSFK